MCVCVSLMVTEVYMFTLLKGSEDKERKRHKSLSEDVSLVLQSVPLLFCHVIYLFKLSVSKFCNLLCLFCGEYSR